jgi:predicted Zn-dependent protease
MRKIFYFIKKWERNRFINRCAIARSKTIWSNPKELEKTVKQIVNHQIGIAGHCSLNEAVAIKSFAFAERMLKERDKKNQQAKN